MTSSRDDPGARTVTKQLKVLLPHSLQRLRISEKLAGCFDVAGGGAPRALVVSPFGKVWRVEVGRDASGAFLGRGWAEFVAAHGVGVGWFVVLRHEGGGALTVKAFDTSLCIWDFGAPAAVITSGSKGISRKPQFISIIHRESMEKMKIPSKFVKCYVANECLDSQSAVISSPLGKFWRVEVKNDQSGMFFAGGWSQFLAFHGISQREILLLRYEGNMVFKFKAFGLNGCQKNFRNQDAITQESPEKQQGEHPMSPRRKRKRVNESPNCPEDGNKAPSEKVAPDYQIGSRPWIKKEININQLKRLSLSPTFCNGIGFVKSCKVILKTEMDSIRSWHVCGLAYDKACYLMGKGWESFCQENNLKDGDICTFNIMETMLWHVTIARLSAPTDNQKQQESPPSSCEYKSRNDCSFSEGKKRYTICEYELGPPSWVRKELTPFSVKRILNLPETFCRAIGLQGTRTIILKTSTSRGKSWQVRILMLKNRKCTLGHGWKWFCMENKLEEGDICTFNVVKTTLWRVVITRREEAV